MNLLASFFRPFYSVEKRSSLEQLRLDFGEFPPVPLRCESLTGEFNVVRASGIGRIYCDLSVLLRALDADVESLSPDLVAKFGAELLDLQSTFVHLGPRASRLVKCILFGWLFVARTAKMLLRGTTRPGVLGMFVPLFRDELQIIINSRRDLQKFDEPTISHEHIHLLQHGGPESYCRHVRVPKELLSEDAWHNSFLLYIMEKIEVEARLHESVLSFFRTHHHLPTTVSGFLGLLASGEEIGVIVANILTSGDVTFNRGQGKYPERYAKPVEHLGWVLIEIKTPELQRRYITEVLPVMYGNLLRYYGDDGASHRFLSLISRPNFYDDLYGAQIV